VCLSKSTFAFQTTCLARVDRGFERVDLSSSKVVLFLLVELIVCIDTEGSVLVLVVCSYSTELEL